MRIAALDLGSNSFHLLVVETRPDGSFVPLVREKEMLRLGDVVAREGRLDRGGDRGGDRDDPAASRRWRTCSDVDEIVAMGTAAMREAANGPEAVERIEDATGVAIKVVSGIREAQLIFEAVRASVLIDPGPALCADLGGGSLELSVGDRVRARPTRRACTSVSGASRPSTCARTRPPRRTAHGCVNGSRSRSTRCSRTSSPAGRRC